MKQFSWYLLVTLMISEIFYLSSASVFSNRSNGTYTRFNCYYAEDQCPNRDIHFWLYTRETQDNPVLLDLLNLTPDVFPEHMPLKILIHGLGLNHNLSPSLEIRPLLLEQESNYVISIDYSSLARPICFYPWALKNCHAVAKCLALLINNLYDSGIFTAQDIHIIGFSLGAQIAGLSANHLNHKVKRITGLDPARPTFDTEVLTERLDSSDAKFVDVIHTDPRFFSMRKPMGHADFYPNYLYLLQPGCNPLEELRNCNHFRAIAYYAESIVTKVGFWSFNCGSYMEYLFNQCTNYSSIPYAQMGYYVDESARGSYFCDTNWRPPYAQGDLVEIELNVEDNIDAET